MAACSLSIVGVLVLCLVSILLAVYSGASKGRAGALSGPVLPLDDDNLLYRIDRVHLNTVEALPPFVVPALLAMMAGVRPNALARSYGCMSRFVSSTLLSICAAAKRPKVAASELYSMSRGHL